MSNFKPLYSFEEFKAEMRRPGAIKEYLFLFLFLMLLFRMFSCAMEPSPPPKSDYEMLQERVQRHAEQSLQGKMKQIQLGMTREAVINIVGAPQWVTIPSDAGEFSLEPEESLMLRWRSPGCGPAEIAFNHQGRVSGWNEGRVCFEGAEMLEPTKEYACNKEDRKKYCRP